MKNKFIAKLFLLQFYVAFGSQQQETGTNLLKKQLPNSSVHIVEIAKDNGTTYFVVAVKKEVQDCKK